MFFLFKILIAERLVTELIKFGEEIAKNPPVENVVLCIHHLGLYRYLLLDKD